uniref:Fibrinogen C-terminal domain-containing protein n=1 Tax=Amphimedon queenslandica TaxID=400682 RepID=A0A1X7U5Y1_AMPQE
MEKGGYEVTDDQYQPEEDDVQLVQHPTFRVDVKDSYNPGSNSLLVKLVGILILLQLVTLIFVIAVVGISASNLLQTDQDEPATTAGSLTATASPGSEDRACNFSLDNGYNNSMLQKEIYSLNMALTQGQGGIAQVLSNTAAMLNNTASKVDEIQDFAEDEATKSMNQTNILNMVMQTTQSTSDKLTDVVSTLSNIKDTGIRTSSVVDDIIGVVQELLELQNASSIFNSITPVSCADIKNALPSSPTGWYHVNSRNIYCNMDELCGSGGGWTRIGYLDMSDATQNCPSSFIYYVNSGKRYCKRNWGCSSTSFSPNGLNYTQICGRVTAFQFAHTDAISPAIFAGQGIDSYYVDGISITRGLPRKHVWTLMSALFENYLSSTDSCPCATGSTIPTPSFVGDDYYCESGNPNSWYANNLLYPNDPLWDGQGCTSLESPCCTNPNLPWFHRNLTNSTNEHIELRSCGNEAPWNEDTPISFYEIYIK